MLLLLFSGICKNQQYTCFNTTSECIALSQRCDGTVDCQEGEDEKFCCEEPSFGCYVNASALSDPYGGTGNLQRYKCLEMGLRCDRTSDCADGSDEIDCKLQEILWSRSVYVCKSFNLVPSFL